MDFLPKPNVCFGPLSFFLYQADNVHVVAYAPSSLLGMPPYVPPGQVAALHPFVMHQQGVPHPSHVMQSHFHSAMSSIQNWQQVSIILFCFCSLVYRVETIS